MIQKQAPSRCLLALLFSGCTTDPSAPSPVGQNAAITSSTQTSSPDPYLSLRLAMVEDTIVARGVVDEDVLPCHAHCPAPPFRSPAVSGAGLCRPSAAHRYGQTISQPYIVAG